MDLWSEETRRRVIDNQWDEIVDLYVEESAADESMCSVCNTILSVPSSEDSNYLELISGMPLIKVMLEQITRAGIEEIKLRIEERGGIPRMKGGDWNG